MSHPECTGVEHDWWDLMFGERWCSICEYFYFPEEEDE